VTNIDRYVGGLAGEVIDNSTVSNCYSTGSVTGTDNYVGGLVGLVRDTSTISNSYSTGTVTGNNYVGGLAGWLYNSTVSVINCYSTGSVTGNGSDVGGLVGRLREDPTVSNSFWDTQTSGKGSRPGGTGQTTAEMKTASTFYDATWAFEEDGNGNDNGTNGGASGEGTDNYWDMDQDGNNYPVLSWQDGATVLVTDLTDPSAPTALIATPGNTQVVLTWAANSEDDLASYKVYRGTSNSTTTLKSTITAGTETSTEDSLTNGTLYYFNISGVDDTGNESSASDTLSSLSHDPSGDYSLSFDGDDDYVNVDKVADEMSSVTDWAVSFWVKPNLNSFPEADGYAVSVNTSSDGNTVLLGMKKIGGFPVVYDGANAATEIVGSTGASISSWNHIVYSRSGSTGTLYLNGVSQGTHIPNYTFSSSDKWTLGGRYDNATITDEYAGFLDEVAVWNDELTAAEITALYNSGMPLDASSNSGNYTSSANVQGYWRFGENSGTTAYDLSGDGNHGTRSGATYSSPGADAAAPTMTITAAEGADGFTSNDATLKLTFTSSEATNNFAVEDITVTNGALSSFTATSSTVYTVTFTPTADGAATIDVADSTFTDDAGNNNTAATQFNWTYNGTPSAPTALIATPGNTQVVLTWAANSEGDLASYKVYGGTSASPTTLLSTITAGTETSTADSLTNSTLYYFKISAVDDAGNESSPTSDVSSLSHDPSGDYSLSFGGDDDYVNVNTVADEMTSVTDWAVSFWVKPNLNSFPEAGGYAVGVNTSSGGNTVLVGMKKIGGFPVVYDGADGDTEIEGSTGASISSWNHIVYSRSGSTGTLYLNGVSQGTHIPSYTFSSSDTWTLGGEYDGTDLTNEYAGFLDEVAVWNDDLTAAEITALYNSGMPLDASSNSGNYTSSANVQGYWRFGENSDTTAYDLSGNGYHGAISGATYNSPGADALDPTMTITATAGSNAVSDGSTTNDSTLTVTFTSSEPTDDFIEGDITKSNGTLSNFSQTSSTVYTVTFTPTADGAATIDVADSTFTDAAGNNNTAADQFNWTYDGTGPTMTFTATNGSNAVSDGSTTNDGTLTVMFTSSEATTDFVEGDISVDNGDLSDFASTSSTVYTATFTPAADGAATIDVGASAFTDAYGNNNTAADTVQLDV